MFNKKNFIYCYKRIFPYVKPYMFRVLVATLISIPIGAMDGLMAYSLKPYMDNVLVQKNLHIAYYVPFAILGFTAIQGTLTYISTYTNSWVGMKITNNIKKHLFNKLLCHETRFYDTNVTGYIVTRFSSDVDTASGGLINNVKAFLSRLFSSISLIVVLLYNSWKLAIIAIIVLLLTFLPLAKLRKKLKLISEDGLKIGSNIYTNFNESCTGNKTIAAYNLHDIQEKKFCSSLDDAFYLSIKSTQISGLVGPLMHFMASIGIAAVVGFGGYLVATKEITGGSFASFLAALVILYTPIKGIGATVLQTQNSLFAIGRILELLDYDPKIQSKENAVELDKIKNGIQFKNVWFEYNKEKLVLRDINLDVKLGETIAFVGSSGGGKSTIVNLIPRFYDLIEGKIMIDGIDIRDISLKSLRNNIAIVFQDNFLFNGTIRENIMLGKPDATQEELDIAVKDSYLEDFVASLDNGLDTEIGERGVLISGGQKQRIAIARALIKNAPLVILDEATSALDNKAEVIVQKALERLMENRTVFVIAHRLSTIQNATKIVVIDDGKIIETGNHEELLRLENGRYKELYLRQFQKKEAVLESLQEI